jgi:hypothetical protein
MRLALEEVPEADMPTAYRCLLLCLATFARPSGAKCFPSTGRLRKACGMSERKLYAAMRELEAAGWIKRDHRHDPETGRQTSTEYRMWLAGSPIRPPKRRAGRGLLPKPTQPSDPQIKH